LSLYLLVQQTVSGAMPLQAVKQIQWDDAYYRSDIGWRAIARLTGTGKK
jgi:phosphoribosylamine--glycine ligase